MQAGAATRTDPTHRHFHVAIGEQEFGPLSEGEIKATLKRKAANLDEVMVWTEGMSAWRPASEVWPEASNQSLEGLLAAEIDPSSSVVGLEAVTWDERDDSQQTRVVSMGELERMRSRRIPSWGKANRPEQASEELELDEDAGLRVGDVAVPRPRPRSLTPPPTTPSASQSMVDARIEPGGGGLGVWVGALLVLAAAATAVFFLL